MKRSLEFLLIFLVTVTIFGGYNLLIDWLNIQEGVHNEVIHFSMVLLISAAVAAISYGVLMRIGSLSTERDRERAGRNETDTKLRSVTENIPDVIWTTASDGRTVYISPRVEKVYGFTPEEIYAGGEKIWLGRIHPDDLEQVLEKYRALFEKRKVYDTEYRIQRKDGSWIWLHDRGVAIYEKDGIWYADGIFMDITERKQAEVDLRESERKYRTLAEASLDPIFIIGQDDTVLYVNIRAAQLLNRSAEQILGKPRKSLFPPDIADGQTSNLQTVFNTGKPLRKEARILYGDREFWQDNSLVPLKDENGNVSAVLGISHDITERKRAEEVLRESEDRYRTLVEIAPDAVIVHQQGIILYANPAALSLVGVSHSGEIIGKKILDFVHPGFRDAVAGNIEKDLRGKRTPHLEVHMLRADGTIVIVEGRGKRIVFDGKPAVQVTLRDITERKAAEEQLRILLREKEILLREIHHRVRNILQMALSAMERERRREPDERVQAALIRTENRLATISFVFDRVYKTENVTRVQFRPIIRDIISRLSGMYTIDLQRITVHAQDLELGIDLAIPLALLANELISNAIQHAFPVGRSGEITINASEREGRIIFVLQDTGAGLAAGVVPDQATSTGFTQVRLLVKQTGGTLSYTSSGKGTSFVITVPRDAESNKSGVSNI